MDTENYELLSRKVKEKFGQSHTLTVLTEVTFPDMIEGGDGVFYLVELDNGKLTPWLRASGLFYETDVPEIESYYSKVEGEWPTSVTVAIALLNKQKHGTVFGKTGATEAEAIVAEVGAVKHKSYLADPTPPDITADLLDDGERNADMS